MIITYSIAIFILCLARPFTLRYCTNYITSNHSAAFIGFWLMLGSILGLPFFYKLLWLNGELLSLSPILIILSFCTGVLIWIQVNNQQIINAESTSSMVFADFISLGIAVLINNFILDEKLNMLQISSIALVGLLGFFFFIYGHAKILSFKARGSYFIAVMSLVLIMAFNQYVISRTNWYFFLFFESLGMFIFSIANPKNWAGLFKALTAKCSLTAGIVYMIGEYVIISSLVTILPVTVANLVICLTIPVVMVSSAFLYKEGGWKEQLLFGALAYLLALPLII